MFTSCTSCFSISSFWNFRRSPSSGTYLHSDLRLELQVDGALADHLVEALRRVADVLKSVPEQVPYRLDAVVSLGIPDVVHVIHERCHRQLVLFLLLQ